MGNADTKTVSSPNFGFLAQHDSLLVEYAARAEHYVLSDPNSALIKLRQFAEHLVKRAAAQVGEYLGSDDTFLDTINRLRNLGVVDPEIAGLLHKLRKSGNDAVHNATGTCGEALFQLRMARTVAIWFHRAFANDGAFKPGPFIPPPDPKHAEAALLIELGTLRDEVEFQRRQASDASTSAEAERMKREAAEQEAERAYADLGAALELAQETEERLAGIQAAFERELATTQAQAATAPQAEKQLLIQQCQEAAAELDMSEADTRKLIDEQLRRMGWQADTQQYSFVNGTRPQRGVNIAIAEWPTSTGPADYVLFAGLNAIGVVEAKRKSKDVLGSIEQAKRYSRTCKEMDCASQSGGPWEKYTIPFMFATNGRSHLKQIETKSGIWFLDGRRKTNHPRALKDWHTPEGLLSLLQQDRDQAEQKLSQEPFDYLPLRDYQVAAIQAVEKALAQGRRQMLVAMATGTGKTRTCIGLVYRLIKTQRFRRILFLVDRSALGGQAADAFKDVRLENLQTFTDIYDLKELDAQHPEPDTRLQIATVQGMVRRLLYPEEGNEPIPVDRYDCIVVDECHRGYTLDLEMSEAELTFRSEEDYISKYRSVLEHFDAVQIGLTATPALHTTQIFGPPIFEYSYRQAVIDGWLVDHEPPIQIVTRLARDGITWLAGEEMAVYHPQTQQLALHNVPDEVSIQIEEFNRRVLTENFNKAVCGELARQIDPSLGGKTLIFCVNDAHADMVTQTLKRALDEQYGGVDDDTVLKITGAADKPQQLIRRFKNENLPAIVTTVDLLTTGIDVPAITNLVFLRRVKSRILYEQMLGRATRLCDDIGKQSFRIFDCVDLYAGIEPHTTMKPVSSPAITFAKLIKELGGVAHETGLNTVKDQLLAKLQRRKRRLEGRDLEQFTALAGMPPAEFIKHVRDAKPAAIYNWFNERPELLAFLDEKEKGGGPTLIISGHEDEVVGIERGYGNGVKPEDYLEAFAHYIKTHMNEIPALIVVTQRPRELTRAQLKELKLLLDQEGYSENGLRTAWRETTNQDIAASIIGHIRRAALGSPLVPYEQRIQQAMETIMASRPWTEPQRKWLDRIGRQLQQETIVDREALDHGQFATQGGFNRLNKVFGGELGAILEDINGTIWQVTA